MKRPPLTGVYGRSATVVIGMLLGSMVALASGARTTPAVSTQLWAKSIAGVYVVIREDTQIRGHYADEAALASPNVDGVSVRTGWDRVEPAPNRFDWSYLDSQMATIRAAHKKAIISVTAGRATPDWVYAAGAKPFHTIVEPVRRREFCSPVTLPVPWDAVFLDRWTKFIKAFGAHFAADRDVVAVKIDGINYRTGETNLPRRQGGEDTGKNGRTCALPDDVRAWKSIGYTSTKVDRAFERIAGTYGESFPHQFLGIMTGEHAFPPIGADGRDDPRADSLSTTDLAQIGRRLLGNRFTAQNNGLHATKTDSGIAALGASIPTGYQGGSGRTCERTHRVHQVCGSVWDMQTMIDNAENAHATFIELFPRDLTNPAFADIMRRTHEHFAK